jgi:hypothetical protein
VGLLHKGMSRRQLERDGTRGDAEIIDIRFTNTSNTHGPVFAVKLAVHAPDGRVFETEGKINASIPSPPSPGQVIPIRYDPKRPSSLIWDEQEGQRQHEQAVEARRAAALGSTEVTAGGVQVVNASGADAATVIEKLARARDQGVISDKQFAEAKRQVESGGAGSASAAAAPGPAEAASVAERLQRLEQLRQQQLLSDEEYSAERKRILDSI